VGLAVVGIVFGLKHKSKGVRSNGTPDALGAYVQQSSTTIDDIKSKVKVFKHKKSGMPVLAITPDDLSQDAVFGMSFRTKITDNTGVAYIVQKAIQDGSKNYSVKDTFNQLERGSLQTYMGTWVDKDRSVYVYSSRNKIDFRDSVSVYLDAIFNPNLNTTDNDWIFRQEAWRLIPAGPNQNLIALSG
jgi:Zn-dependent M16 (insulinase) family peptidase